MGYGGYAPGMNSRQADGKTPLQEALQSLPLGQAQDTLEIMDKLIRNVVRNPSEEKFRSIKLTNPKIAASITDVPGAIDILKEMGWVQQGECMLLPASVRLVHEREVLGIISAQEHYKTEAEKEARRLTRARKELDGDQLALKQQMEIDRKEKAADGPVTRSSVAKQLGEGQKMTAGDIGIGKGSGG